MTVAQRMGEQDYVAFVASGIEGVWELHDGRLVEKPGMSWKHLNMIPFLIAAILPQLNPGIYRVVSECRVRRPPATVFLPDIAIVPLSYAEGILELPILPIFSGPLPLVVEIWSPSTGDYDTDTKVPAYQQRGDHELWRTHPIERTLTKWVRQANGEYDETSHRGGVLALDALPEVTIDLDAMFAF
jgi:Uma2 family endonuclease